MVAVSLHLLAMAFFFHSHYIGIHIKIVESTFPSCLPRFMNKGEMKTSKAQKKNNLYSSRNDKLFLNYSNDNLVYYMFYYCNAKVKWLCVRARVNAHTILWVCLFFECVYMFVCWIPLQSFAICEVVDVQQARFFAFDVIASNFSFVRVILLKFL